MPTLKEAVRTRTRPGAVSKVAQVEAAKVPLGQRLAKKPIVDFSYTSRHSEVQLRTGSVDAGVEASIDLCISDDQPVVDILWKVERWEFVNGKFQQTEPEPSPHGGLDFGADEIEAWATALYQAVQLAKKQGYLPAVTGGAES